MLASITLAAALALSGAQATATAPSPDQQRADAAYQAQDWAAAANGYEAIAKAGQASGQTHLRLAIALSNLKRDTDAIPHLRKAEEMGVPLGQVALRLASIHGRAGRLDEAFAELDRVVRIGLTAIPPQMDNDATLKPLRDDPRYKNVLAAIDRNARPCEHDPKYREFDFWIGEWEVRAAGAPPAAPPASNVITKIHGGCVVLETWTAPGQTGQSFNIYDRSRGKWHQAWVDSTGGLHEYWGELKDGNMVYTGDLPPLRGQTARRQVRLTFFKLDENTVRQFSESTPDGGKTWQTNYDLIYKRRVKSE